MLCTERQRTVWCNEIPDLRNHLFGACGEGMVWSGGEGMVWSGGEGMVWSGGKDGVRRV